MQMHIMIEIWIFLTMTKKYINISSENLLEWYMLVWKIINMKSWNFAHQSCTSYRLMRLWIIVVLYLCQHYVSSAIVTAQQQPQTQQQNKQNCSLVETKYRWEPPPPPFTTHHLPSTTTTIWKLHGRAEIEQYYENKSY